MVTRIKTANFSRLSVANGVRTRMLAADKRRETVV